VQRRCHRHLLCKPYIELSARQRKCLVIKLLRPTPPARVSQRSLWRVTYPSGVDSPARTVFSPAIRVDGLTKRFGRVVAVEDLSMTVAPGEVFGFLGPNGAGKSTTIRLLLGLIRPTAGSAKIFGCAAGDVRRSHRIRAR
jgi:ABC-type glutathione transport system ATPase component